MRDTPQSLPKASSPSSAPDLKRRRFLLAVSAGGAGAVAAASPARAATAAAEPSADPTESPASRGSAHVKPSYDTPRT